MYIQSINISQSDVEKYLTIEERKYLAQLLLEIRKRKSVEILQEAYNELEELKQELRFILLRPV